MLVLMMKKSWRPGLPANTPKRGPRLFSLLTLASLACLLSLAQCTPEPRTAHCSNDADCPDGERGRAYCANSRCVECVTNAACGAHRRCAAGRCVERSG